MLPGPPAKITYRRSPDPAVEYRSFAGPMLHASGARARWLAGAARSGLPAGEQGP